MPFNLNSWLDRLNNLIKDKFTYTSSWTNPNPPEPIRFNDEIENPSEQVKQYVPTPAENIPQGGYKQRTPGAYEASRQPVPIQREYADRPPIPEDYIPYITESSQTYGVDPNILASLLASESGGFGYDPALRGASEEVGVAQIIPKFHYQDAGFNNVQEYANALLDPAYSIDQAALILSDLLNEFDQNYYDALAAYNVGATGYSSGNYEPLYPIDTLKRVGMLGDYVSQVPAGYEEYLPEELLSQYLAIGGGM